MNKAGVHHECNLDHEARSMIAVQGNEFLRTLRRCVSPDGSDVSRYTLNGGGTCPQSYTGQVVLGYVR